MAADAISIGLSGITSAHKRIEVASHNVANLVTEDFHPLKAHQVSQQGGGSKLEVEVSAEPESVSIAEEFVGSRLAVIQAKASARVVDTELELLGSLLDLHA